MNIVKKLNKHTIYYYVDNKIKYYINVPHQEFDTTNISLEFLEDTSKYDPDINDIEWVKSNIIEYYKKVDNDNITLVLPILKNEEKDILLSLNKTKLDFVEKLMALYINSSYISLSKNSINVNKEIYLIENNKFNNFINYFKEKHNSRIVVKRLIEINVEENKEELISNDINNVNINNTVLEQKKEIVKPFSINENILNDVMLEDKKNIDNEDLNIENNIVINELNNDNSKIENNNSPSSNNSSNIQTINSDNKEKQIQEDTNIIQNNNNLDKNQNENNNKIEEKVNENYTLTTNEENNDKKPITNEEVKVTNIINPNNEIKENEKKVDPVNNIINISDLGSLTAGGLNGSLPGNVTINIEKLVTENNENTKLPKNDDEADEVSELDEDISDIDEFDENEDFDLDAIDVSEAVLSSDDGNKTYRTVISGGVKFVVGRKDDENLKPIEINKPTNNLDINNNNLNIEMPTNIVKGDDQINKNAGFASYFTLFFVAISALFIIVYIIVK